MTDMGQAARFRSLHATAMRGTVRIALVAGLAALLWATASEHADDGSPAVPLVLLVGTAVAWGAWLVASRLGAPQRITWVTLATLSGVGGAVGGLAPVGITFPAVAVIAAATLVDPLATCAVGVLGVASLTLTVLIAGSPRAIIVEGVLAIAAAFLGGASRRQYQDRATQAEALLIERMRADAERDRAAALAERNRVGREVHDVLAHSLGALSVQLEAADALLETDGPHEQARELVQRARRLAVDGLAEARKAVHALRDAPVVLSEQLAALAATDSAELSIVGAERRLSPDAELALYRAGQEALTNARKHAPGAMVTLRLTYESGATVLTIVNGASPKGNAPGPLSGTGAGAGLRGMRERIEMLGGDISAGPDASGWIVRAAVPA
jgi:signal transduction histidine kinase